jgi:hypothetical protein
MQANTSQLWENYANGKDLLGKEFAAFTSALLLSFSFD